MLRPTRRPRTAPRFRPVSIEVCEDRALLSTLPVTNLSQVHATTQIKLVQPAAAVTPTNLSHGFFSLAPGQLDLVKGAPAGARTTVTADWGWFRGGSPTPTPTPTPEPASTAVSGGGFESPSAGSITGRGSAGAGGRATATGEAAPGPAAAVAPAAARPNTT